ncbi:MAG: AAA family ATPase [Magnetococcales bacterium]|nr:AAA family ATPase [Magnetococcales bacterium]MBF0420308.1 AAA family ATPase [Magnetococcales bacterium]
MIIRHLKAENILRFAHLDLSFPTRGNIVISGDNESGKSAIFETICLALFGRTANLDHNQIEKILHWGTAQGSISLDFISSSGQNVTIHRQFNRQEPHTLARLIVQDQEVPLAGAAEVDEAMIQAAGMEFSHFLETAYLSQGSPEGENPEAIVRMVAGVDDLESLSAQLEAEIRSGRDQQSRLNAELTGVTQELTDLNLQPQLLPELQQKFAVNTERQKSLETTISNQTRQIEVLRSGFQVATGHLSNAIEQGRQATLPIWHHNLKSLQSSLSSLTTLDLGEAAAMVARIRSKAQQTIENLQAFNAIVNRADQDRQSRSHWLSGTDAETLAGQQKALTEEDTRASLTSRRGIIKFLVFLPLGLPMGLGGFALSFFSHNSHISTLAQSLAKQLPHMETIHLHAAMGMGLFFLMISFFGLGQFINSLAVRSHNKQARYNLQLRAGSEQKIVAALEESAKLTLCQQIARLNSLGDKVEWQENLQLWMQSHGRNMGDEQALLNLIAQFKEDADRLHSVLEGMFKRQDDALRQAREQLSAVTDNLAILDQEIRHEQQRHQRHQSLQARHQELTASYSQTSHGVDVRTLGRRLIHGTIHEIALAFSHELKRQIAKSAPLFTHGRYQHLRVDDKLNLSAFSPSKNDYVDMLETSRGLRRQLMLALRFALTQAITARTQAHAQFMMLDEPFAHYDRDRFLESYRALAGISDTIQQFFIASQSFDKPLLQDAALHIHCTLDTNSLELAVA